MVSKHAFKNAVIPVMTIAGIDLGALMGGAILTETVFSRPGIGLMIYQAIGARDLPVVAGGVLFATIVYVFANLFVDLGYALGRPAHPPRGLTAMTPFESKDAKPQTYAGQETSGNIVTEDLTISTVSERDIIEAQIGGPKPLGLWADTWRRLRRNKLAVVGMCIIIVFLIVGTAEVIAVLRRLAAARRTRPTRSTTRCRPRATARRRPGRTCSAPTTSAATCFSRVLVATRISMLVGVIAVAIALTIGLILGPISGLLRRLRSTPSSCAPPTSSSPSRTSCSCCSS